MPVEIAAPAAGGAGAGGGAPAAGSGGGAPGGGGAPAAPTAPQSDEQILGIDPVGSAPVEETPAAAVVPKTAQEQAAEAAKVAADAAKTPEQLKAESDARAAEDKAIPAKWAELAKTDPEFRTLYFTAKSNAEKLATMEPKFTELQTTVAAVEKADQAYLSGDPVAIQGELKTFLAEKPDALIPMYQAGESLLKELMPQEYDRMTVERVTTALKGNNFDKAFEVLRSALDAGDAGIDTLKTQVKNLVDWADGNGFPTTEKARVESRARELDTREATARTQDEQKYNQSTHAFKDTVNAKIGEAHQTNIKAALDTLLKDSAFTDGAKARITEDALKEINKMLALNTGIVDQIGKAIWPNGSKDAQGKLVRGVFNDTNRELAIRLPVEYAKSVMNDVLQKTIETYTKDFMASQQTAEKRMAAAAGKTEVSGGSPAPRGQKPLSKKDIDYSKQSDDDILAL